MKKTFELKLIFYALAWNKKGDWNRYKLFLLCTFLLNWWVLLTHAVGSVCMKLWTYFLLVFLIKRYPRTSFYTFAFFYPLFPLSNCREKWSNRSTKLSWPMNTWFHFQKVLKLAFICVPGELKRSKLETDASLALFCPNEITMIKRVIKFPYSNKSWNTWNEKYATTILQILESTGKCQAKNNCTSLGNNSFCKNLYKYLIQIIFV